MGAVRKGPSPWLPQAYSRQKTLYSIYRKGLITRHITKNGRFLESIALESIDNIDESSLLNGGSYIDVEHSTPFGHKGPNVTIRFPVSNARYSEEIDPSGPIVDGKYTVKPHLWIPLIAPIKYPGVPQYEEGIKGPAPWLPQAYYRKRHSMQKTYYVACSSRADNPGYYGGMALAAFALEAMYGVSPHSIKYARKLIQGFLAMEMNGRNGYIIRHNRWHTNPNEVKKIRGASPEELLGIMLGIMFYLKAEHPNHPLYTEAEYLRNRILWRVSRGIITHSYYHPFMRDSFYMKHFEVPLYASKGEERGSTFLYNVCRTGSVVFVPSKFLMHLAIYLTSIILILEGDLPVNVKENYWAKRLMYYIKACKRNKYDQVHKNAYMGVVALLINKYLNPQRDCHAKSDNLMQIWTRPSPDAHPSTALDITTWDEMIRSTEERIFFCKSLDNELVEFREEFRDHWQHNLPLFTVRKKVKIIDYPDWMPIFSDVYEWQDCDWPGVWKNHNPHQRIGMHFEWKSPSQWWANSKWKFLDYAFGWHSDKKKGRFFAEANEWEYNKIEDKRFDSNSYFEKEVSQFRKHNDNQIEASGMSLLFLRMLLTHINPDRYPPPRLPDRNTFYPVLPFRGVEPLEPKFLHYEHHYRSVLNGWEIGGDKNKALRVLAFPSKGLIVTATADDEDKLTLSSWRVSDGGFVRLYTRTDGMFEQVILRKTSSTGSEDDKDILVTAERAEEDGDYYLRISTYKVYEHGALPLLASRRMSGKGSGAVKELDMCILNFNYVAVTFKTRHNKARIKIIELNFENNEITERANIKAESGSGRAHREIGDAIWIGSAWNNGLINGYTSESGDYYYLYSRNWYGNSFGETHSLRIETVNDKPVSAVTFKKGSKYYLVVASYGSEGFLLKSFEIARGGELKDIGDFLSNQNSDKKYLLRHHGYDFDLMSIARTRFDKDGRFLIAAKGRISKFLPQYEDYWGKGLIVLYGGLTGDGFPTLWDWNCFGSGRGGVKMVDVCGEVRVGDKSGFLTAYKDKENGLLLTWWRFGEDFRLDSRFRIDPPGSPRSLETSISSGIDGVDGND
jgi:hypothetical protein